jgi:hypothetical protein
MNKTIAYLFLLAFLNNSYANASSKAQVQMASGKVNSNIKIVSTYRYCVRNDTNMLQQYIGYELLEVNGQAQIIPFLFYLNGNGQKNVNEIKSFDFKFNKVGRFVTKATIKITGNADTEDSGESFVNVMP